jgi:predicted HicB family RNase H-like nuclease
LRAEFKKPVQVSGTFNLRIPPELHEQLAIAAQAEGKSIIMLAQEALRGRVTS